ncbi:OLC1v1016331C3 [Oldenlandia corymbosa var. corymbosa]|uniref:OLC1v1016331C3 n=1 Tax=Oldenlandia corymbosa var. corymbosa TaxID=529605 RepID=A0AAV1E5F6_OLDCO|nr:OLC1v1016331C3 [Oldenlandia corymbosa var. corymbosa]
MAEEISVMDIDGDDYPNVAAVNNKGKSVAVSNNIGPKSIPWVEKYRPQSLSDVAAHRDIVDTIDRLASSNRLPHLLLYGPPGTGKTSTVLALARKLYGSQMHNMVLDLNASDDRGIDVVRQQIQDFASTQSISFGAKFSVKLVLLDEADAMTKDAQFALRRVIEKYTKNTRFALICNHVNKIITALQSRCTRFRFAPLDAVHVTERLNHVIKAEGLDVTESGLKALVRLCNGDMRKALNILQVIFLLAHLWLVFTFFFFSFGLCLEIMLKRLSPQPATEFPNLYTPCIIEQTYASPGPLNHKAEPMHKICCDII